MSRKRTALLFAATLAACALALQASAERLRFEGSFNLAVFGCDTRAFECLPGEWLDFGPSPITPIPFSFTIDVTRVSEQGDVFRSDTWVAPSLVPNSLISGVLSDSSAAGLPPFTQATFDALVGRRYAVFRSISGNAFSDGSLRWSAIVSNSWQGVVPPAPTDPDDFDDPMDFLRFYELVRVNLQQPGAATPGPASFADLVGLFDHYLASQRSVDLTADFGYSRGDPRTGGSSSPTPFGRMGGSFRLASIQCRTPSAASNLLGGLGVAVRGPH